VAIEGVDGSGKTTLSSHLTESLRRRGYTPIQLTEPSYSPLGREIRANLANPGVVSQDDLHEMFTRDRQHQVHTKLRPLLQLSRSQPELALVVIQDRSYYSTAAYQRVDFPIEPTIAEQEEFAPRPQVVILLDVPIETAIVRLRERGPREDDGDPRVLGRARDAYLLLANRYDFDVRDATAPPDKLSIRIADQYWPTIEVQ
jgi:dTMP kinase